MMVCQDGTLHGRSQGSRKAKSSLQRSIYSKTLKLTIAMFWIDCDTSHWDCVTFVSRCVRLAAPTRVVWGKHKGLQELWTHPRTS
eukprot:569998-Amphidinium_carterae.3